MTGTPHYILTNTKTSHVIRYTHLCVLRGRGEWEYCENVSTEIRNGIHKWSDRCRQPELEIMTQSINCPWSKEARTHHNNKWEKKETEEKEKRKRRGK